MTEETLIEHIQTLESITDKREGDQRDRDRTQRSLTVAAWALVFMLAVVAGSMIGLAIGLGYVFKTWTPIFAELTYSMQGIESRLPPVEVVEW